MKRQIFISVFLVLLLSVMSFTIAAAQDDPSLVTVIHGIPGEDLDPSLGLDPTLPVDVCVNGEALITDFVYGSLVGPVEIPADTYDITIQLAEGIEPGDACLGTTVIDLSGEDVQSGKILSIIAHRTGDGLAGGLEDVLGLGITATIFVNDVSDIVAGHVRLTIRHTAAAPEVDIPIQRGGPGGRLIATLEDLSNGKQAGPLDIRPGGYTYALQVDGETVFGPNFLALPEAHKSYIVYAVGTFPETFGLIVQIIDLDKVPPSKGPAGPPEEKSFGPPEWAPAGPPEGKPVGPPEGKPVGPPDKEPEESEDPEELEEPSEIDADKAGVLNLDSIEVYMPLMQQ